MTFAKQITFGILMMVPGASAVAEDYPTSNTPRAVYKMVQTTPSYSIQRPQLTVGTRITMFANFLQQDAGVVMLDIAGTTSQCELLDWKPNSVTVQLPHLGLARPTNAKIRIILPNGRIAKTFSVLMIAQPEIVVHSETIAQPMPAPAVATPEKSVYAESIDGGFAFYESE